MASSTFVPLQPHTPDSALDQRNFDAPRARVRDLPTGIAPGSAPATFADLRALARTALGAESASHLEKVVSSDRELYAEALDKGNVGPYPGKYPEVEQLLDAAPERAASVASSQLAAGLMVLAAAPPSGALEVYPYPNAALVAYALLQRARRVVGCDAEVDLLMLLATDIQPHDNAVLAQGRTATAACPGDPTPGWILTQFQSERAVVATLSDLSELAQPVPADRMERVRHTVEQLAASFPGSADVRTVVGDATSGPGKS